MKTFPETNPDNLNDCLKIFEEIKYESYGFPVIFLDYDYSFRHWSVSFRNPVNFSNPDIKEDDPLIACHKMLDFLRNIKKENEKSNN